jgi:HD-like signal output (HDOD) protein
MTAILTNLAAQPADERAEGLVREVRGLVSPPDICVKVFELLGDPNTSIGQIGEVIIRDPNLTARLLKLVNSSFYNFSSRIDTVSRAITVIGIRELYNLLVAVSAVKSFSRIPNTLVNMDVFWRHSIYCGLISRILAARCHVLHPERLFIAGLLHDIGSLVLYHRMPEASMELLMTADGNEDVLHQAEIERFGFSHAHLGGLLLNMWQLPLPLQDAVRHHHSPALATQSGLDAAIIHVADALANHSEIGAYCEDTAPDVRVDPSAWRVIDANTDSPAEQDIEGIIGEAGLQFAETATLLMPRD